MQAVRVVTALDDAGAGMSAGQDIVMLIYAALVPLLLAMLHMLRPPMRWRAPHLQQTHQTSDVPAPLLPVAVQVAEAAVFCPTEPPFEGYRTAILSGQI